MPVVTVEMWEGRTIEQKKQLVEGITLAMTNIGVPAAAVHIIIKDVLSTTGRPVVNWLRKNPRRNRPKE